MHRHRLYTAGRGRYLDAGCIASACSGPIPKMTWRQPAAVVVSNKTNQGSTKGSQKAPKHVAQESVPRGRRFSCVSGSIESLRLKQTKTAVSSCCDQKVLTPAKCTGLSAYLFVGEDICRWSAAVDLIAASYQCNRGTWPCFQHRWHRTKRSIFGSAAGQLQKVCSKVLGEHWSSKLSKLTCKFP